MQKRMINRSNSGQISFFAQPSPFNFDLIISKPSMPKHLYLLRHAEAGEKTSGQHDKDRDLTSKGVKQSVQVGSFLKKHNFAIDAIYTSTAVRTKETTSFVSDTLKFDQRNVFNVEELYEASTRTFLQFICELDNGLNNVMCVGHNPTISYLAEYLTKAELPEMATGSLAIISFNIDSWAQVSQGSGTLVNYVDNVQLMN
jgi:phosphohistidine phosphatase